MGAEENANHLSKHVSSGTYASAHKLSYLASEYLTLGERLSALNV